MAIHSLGKKQLRRLSRALGQPVYRAWLTRNGHNTHAICFVDRETVARIDYKTLAVLAPPSTDHPYGPGWYDDRDMPPNPLI